MNRTARRLVVTTLAAGAAVTMTPMAANATIHEIVAQYCSGRAELEPPGVSTEGKKNFARPVLANGVVTVVVTTVDGVTNTKISIDESHPAFKLEVVEYVTVPAGQGATFTFPLMEPDPSFPAFQHCPKLPS
jgi:hypothetical protein